MCKADLKVGDIVRLRCNMLLFYLINPSGESVFVCKRGYLRLIHYNNSLRFTEHFDSDEVDSPYDIISLYSLKKDKSINPYSYCSSDKYLSLTQDPFEELLKTSLYELHQSNFINLCNYV